VSNPSEEQFEESICDWLRDHGGYVAIKNDLAQGPQPDFNPTVALDTGELFTFIGATQIDAWYELVKRYGGDQPAAQAKFADRLASELDKRGTVDVLRHGVVDLGVTIKLAYFRPAHGLTPELVQRYRANRPTATQQLRYQPNSTKVLDLALFVNGIPVATAELKNPLTGQGVEQAVTRHATAYLWEQVWSRDAWLDLLGRFVHVDKPAKGSKKPAQVIFPRYHQWDAVLRIEAAAREEGAGHSYLVQHSAGSGKSNTIAWLAHRLSTLHAGDTKVFDKVIVITDRVVLDRQLQDTIYQFEHAHGLVERIDEDSAQLASALSGEQARVIITTLWKFPYAAKVMASLPSRRYAVIADEAHSSQTGDAAKELRKLLGSAAAEAGDEELPADAAEEALLREVLPRGHQPNLSFFAFTATPKGKTLEHFGRLDPTSGKHQPFHLYSMRQAIEERFIHDVLASYITYQTYLHLEKTITDDPAYETVKARRAIARFLTLHEHNLAQKAEIVLEHFRRHIAHKVAGRAKAMVVCSSRPHALRFADALRTYARNHGYDTGILVAFSGALDDDSGEPTTEAKWNGYPDTQTAEVFDSDAYSILVVAEKFQTGFNQPKLYAMYVDKTLTGLAAVQTLSRLNRTHPDKDGTFVLDFANDADDIRAAFEPYYGKTVAPPSDPNLLYDTRHTLDEFGVLSAEDATTFARLLLVERVDHGRLHAVLGPAIDRFHGLAEDEQDRFRDTLGRFVRVYSFLSQIVTFADPALERDYRYAKSLQAFTKADAGQAVDVSGALELTHLRHEQQFAGSVSLDRDSGEVSTISSGTGRQAEPDPEPLSAIISRLNERYGADWRPEDRLVLDATLVDVVNDKSVQVQAANNSAENFGLVAPQIFTDALLGRMDRNEKVVFEYLDNQELQAEVLRFYIPRMQARARIAYQEHCPIAELLSAVESAHLEFKSTLRTAASTGEVVKPLETACVKTVAAFANSVDGDTLLIGVADDGTVHGLAGDYASLHKEGKDDRDVFQLHLAQVLINALGETVASSLSTQLHTVDGQDLCRLHVPPSSFPVDAHVVVDRKGQLERKVAFYIRIGNGTREITDAGERQRYLAHRWGTAAA